MPRPPRVDFAGAWHHVMHRGARRAPIFKRPEDCQSFLDHLDRSVTRTGIEIHAYALMPNHYHLLVRSPLATLSRGLQILNSGQTLWLNKKYAWDGPVFRGRFTSVLITDPRHLDYLLAYIHLNPLRGNLVRRLTDHAWTSHRAYLGLERAPAWLSRDHFFSVLDGKEGVHDFVKGVHQRRNLWPEDLDHETGFPIAAEEGETPVDLSSQATREEVRTEDLNFILVRISNHCGVSVRDLFRVMNGPGANPARRFAAWALSYKTHSTRTEVAELLGMSTEQVFSLLHQLRNLKRPEPLDTWIADWITASEC